MQVAEEVKTYICICCPLGCQLELSFAADKQVVEVGGYGCIRGKDYALSEASDPRRMVTSFVCAEGCLEPLSVKTAAPVPKHLVADILQAIAALHVRLPIKSGDVLIEDVCGSGIAVVATRSLNGSTLCSCEHCRSDV